MKGRTLGNKQGKGRNKELAVTPRAEDYSKWYIDVIMKAELADYSPVKGCMVIRPNGYAIWEKMKAALDRKFKETGHRNAYFPLLIPQSFLTKEAEHVEGFAPQCAVVTHGGGSKLEEPLVVRPTSETMMYEMYRKWVRSYRDLPILINQWANVYRWEMRTRLFLRTSEFLWQEGHTVHATKEESLEETLKMLQVYKTFSEEYMAVPVITGVKTPAERFPGAVDTYCIEAMMQDKKALQAGTSHMLGQNFAKGFDVKYQDEEGEWKYVWGTSWGVSTRLIGALIMAHSDDKGLVIPPRLAANPVVIIPIYKKKNEEQKKAVLDAAYKLRDELTKEPGDILVDARDGMSPGFKYSEWEQKGIPVRIELGPRDLEKNSVMVARRDGKPKEIFPMEGLPAAIDTILEDIQKGLFERALTFRVENTHEADDYEEFKKALEADGGFWHLHWCESAECEKSIQEETKATIRCIADDIKDSDGVCIKCGKPSKRRVVFAKSY